MQTFTSFDKNSLDKLVTLLKSHNTEFISGEKLCKSLGLSRAAVWKNVKRLKSLGYKIESKPKIGYKLFEDTSLLLPWEVLDGLQTNRIGRKIYYFDTIDSTQNFALRLSEKPHENGSLVIAEKQTKGRGRLNRRWVSPKGGIWLSILLKPDIEISQTSLFPMITSLALTKAIEKTLRLDPKIKWPNDITLKGKKVAGILIDAAVESNKIDYVVIGVGINFRVDPRKISDKIKDSRASHGVTTLLREDQESDPKKLIQEFLLQLELLHDKIISNNLSEVRKQWLQKSSTIGKTVTVSTHNEIIKGRAITIDENGALVVSRRGKLKHILVGDISYL